MGGVVNSALRPTGSSNIWATSAGSVGGAVGGGAGAAPKPFFNQFSSKVWAGSAGSGGGATGGALGAADGATRVGGGTGVGVVWSGGWTRSGTVVVMGAEVRHGAEAVTQARIPPRPLSGSFVNPTLYLAFSASGSAFQRWPGAWQGAGVGAKGLRIEVTGSGRGRGGNMGLGRDRGHAGQGTGR